MACLENVISDYNVELQRLIQGDETTRGTSSIAKVKEIAEILTKKNHKRNIELNGIQSGSLIMNPLGTKKFVHIKQTS